MVCEKCWAEARRRHANGAGESVTEVYNHLIDRAWCKTQGDTIDLMAILVHSLKTKHAGGTS